MGERRRRCAGKVPTADGESDCELPAQDNSIYCHGKLYRWLRQSIV